VAVALESEHVGRDAVEEESVMADDDGPQPAKSSSASSSRAQRIDIEIVVGSSSNNTLAPDFSILRDARGLRSPPESEPTFFCGRRP